jgi:hypothetical protein
MSSAATIVRDLWQMLGLGLPPKRRPQLARYFAGFKPLHPSAYGSLLRAMARALIEADHVGVTRDSPQDPVELIAAALEVGIEQSERGADDLCDDVAIRIAAFERLYCVRARHDRLDALAHALGRCIAEPAELFVTSVEDARREVGALSSWSSHSEALLAELVIVGRCPTEVAALAASRPSSLPLARAAVLARAGRFSEALDACRAILDRVPGHTLALQQAARCCIECGAAADARVYARRASGLIEARRGGR